MADIELGLCVICFERPSCTPACDNEDDPTTICTECFVQIYTSEDKRCPFCRKEQRGTMNSVEGDTMAQGDTMNSAQRPPVTDMAGMFSRPSAFWRAFRRVCLLSTVFFVSTFAWESCIPYPRPCSIQQIKTTNACFGTDCPFTVYLSIPSARGILHRRLTSDTMCPKNSDACLSSFEDNYHVGDKILCHPFIASWEKNVLVYPKGMNSKLAVYTIFMAIFYFCYIMTCLLPFVCCFLSSRSALATNNI